MKKLILISSLLLLITHLKAQEIPVFRASQATMITPVTLQPKVEMPNEWWLGYQASTPNQVSLFQQKTLKSEGAWINKLEVVFFTGEYHAAAFRITNEAGAHQYLTVSELGASATFQEIAGDELPLGTLFYTDQEREVDQFTLISGMSKEANLYLNWNLKDKKVTLAKAGQVWLLQEANHTRIVLGESPIDLVKQGVPVDFFYGKMYKGGLIFYIDVNNDYPELDVLVTTPQDQSFDEETGNLIPVSWMCQSKVQRSTNLGTERGISKGSSNTDAILRACNGQYEIQFAAKMCRDLGPEWYLPSTDELKLMMANLYKNKKELYFDFHLNNDFEFYWSSSEKSEGESFGFNNEGEKIYVKEDNTGQVRAVRSIKCEVSVQSRLDNGATPIEIVNSGVPVEDLYGKTYKGGIIFYLNPANGKGMVAATEDQNSAPIEWGCLMTNLDKVPNTITLLDHKTPKIESGAKIGDGSWNTNAIIADCAEGDIAAKVCRAKGSQWFLPSLEELNLMHTNLHKKGLGKFSGQYWSSSELDKNAAWYQNFDDGNQKYVKKEKGKNVRAAQSF